VATGARFRVKGDLQHFPFKDPSQGEFQITADVRDVTYAFVPPGWNGNEPAWPALTQLAGTLVFERNGMQVRNAAGHFSTGPALQVRTDAQIPDFGQTQVAVSGQVRGPLAQALAVVNASPLSALLGHALAKATAGGNADIQLKLQLPIAALDKSRVDGSVTLAGNDIQFTPDSPLLTRSRGAVTFSERGFTLAGAQARTLGGDVRIDGGTRPAGAGGGVSLRAQGTATAEGLRQARELGVAARLARDASGSAAYALGLSFRGGVPEIVVTSNLQGLGLNLPAPLGKPADAALALRYENTLLPDPAGTPAGAPPVGDRVLLELGRVASIAYERNLRGPEPSVLRGAIAVGLGPGEASPMPEQGVMANINLARVDLDAWDAVLSRAVGSAPATPASGGSAAAGAPTAPTAAMAYLPTVIAVRAKELTLQGRTLHNVVVGGSRDGQTWRANVDAGELNGYAEYRQPPGGGGRLHARLARLSIAASAAKEVEALLDEQPERLPALDIVVEDFELLGRKLGRLEIDAVNRGAVRGEAGAREWRLNKLNLAMPEAEFSATGNWAAIGASSGPGAERVTDRAAAGRRRTAMKFRLDISDAGLLLARFGMKDMVRRGKGRMEGQVAWLGSPLSLNYASMDGAFYANVEAGQFLKADPGLAKLLGVLSLQSLPRRLALDFRDVFSEGFAFDFLRGDVTIEDGMAATNNLQMKGVNAAVLMEGRADIARETQDLKVVVVPEINAGTASLVAGVINPAIGLGTFLAQMVLREPLIRAATQEFHVDGTWAEPRITRVARRPAETRTGGPDLAPRPQGVN